MSTRGIYKRGRLWWITYVDCNGIQQFESSKSQIKADAEYMVSLRKKSIYEGVNPVFASNVTLAMLAKRYKSTITMYKQYQGYHKNIDMWVSVLGENCKVKNCNLRRIELRIEELLASSLQRYD